MMGKNDSAARVATDSLELGSASGLTRLGRSTTTRAPSDRSECFALIITTGVRWRNAIHFMPDQRWDSVVEARAIDQVVPGRVFGDGSRRLSRLRTVTIVPGRLWLVDYLLEALPLPSRAIGCCPGL
jgi:hypothetical protein